ncbi:MAG TPA: hypothetical protein ENI23_09845 [bacterium]|nr:hypothetical protein [bacterium]
MSEKPSTQKLFETKVAPQISGEGLAEIESRMVQILAGTLSSGFLTNRNTAKRMVDAALEAKPPVLRKEVIGRRTLYWYDLDTEEE